MENPRSKRPVAPPEPGIKWSGQYRVAQSQIQHTPQHGDNVQKPLPPGDKIILPPSALQALLSAIASKRLSKPLSSTNYPPFWSPSVSGMNIGASFDSSQHLDDHPYDRLEDLQQSQQLLPHPLMFRIVNSATGRIVYAGVREFSAEEGEVVLSSFLKSVLGINNAPRNDDVVMGETDEEDQRPFLAIHAVQLPKGTHVKLRPLEAGYDPEDWKALLEEHLRANYTTLTRGEILAVPSGKIRKDGVTKSSYEAAQRADSAVESNGVSRDGKVANKRENGVEEEDVFKFIIDTFQPDSDGICIVDTDLEVDIEALNEEQARETVRRITAKAKAKASNRLNGSTDTGIKNAGSSKETDPLIGGNLDLFKPKSGLVTTGDYIDYEISSWDRTRGLEITLEIGDLIDDKIDTFGSQSNDDKGGNACMLDLLVSPFGPRQRARPRTDEFVLADFSEASSKKIRIMPAELEEIMGVGQATQEIWVAVYASDGRDTSSVRNGKGNAYEGDTTRKRMFKVSASVTDSTADGAVDAESVSSATISGPDRTGEPGEVQCKNCNQWIPEQRLVLHENFCLRNNVVCKDCAKVFQKRSATWEQHWHCHLPHDLSSTILASINYKSASSSSFPLVPSFSGNTSTSYSKHTRLFHAIYNCSACARSDNKSFPSLVALAHHRITICPAKLILCQFCHLLVPQDGDSNADTPAPEVVISGLTPHELEDGARTTECHLCDRIVRLRDMSSHILHHELEKKRRVTPRVCRNVLCGRIIGDGTAISNSNNKSLSNNIGLCSTCFGPLYVSQYDPDGKSLKRRVERRYLSQMLTGCGRSWCTNTYCKTGRANQKPDRNEDSNISSGNTGEDGKSAPMTTRVALPLIKPSLEGLFEIDTAGSARDTNCVAAATSNNVAVTSKPSSQQTPLHFCVDEASQRRRTIAEVMAATASTATDSGGNTSSHTRGTTVDKVRRWALGWWIVALEVKGTENIEGAIGWLEGYAPEIES